MTHLTFRQKAEKHWTPERIRKLTGGKSYLIDPLSGAELLRSLGLLNADASMPADAVRKYAQINHMVALMQPPLSQLSERFPVLRILDCGCGNSYLTFLLAWCFKNVWKKKVVLTGIDTRADVIAKSTARAHELGLEDYLSFEQISVQDYQKRRDEIADPEARKASRNHVIVGLHACDTATDDALALAFSEKSDAIAVAPCCQAELANRWRKLSAEHFKNAFSVLIQSPELRRDSCSTFTDALRVLLMRGQGYEVTTTEFVPSAHTPKNRLILAQRRGNYFEPALHEYLQMRTALGAGIGLEARLSGEASEILQRLSALE
ncbi:MAG: SAM-dependent methyltransferase [Betaproteobacteria bacterium]|nr:SAM-dependent methyltransferase [Betaproteobacteria bacterium]